MPGADADAFYEDGDRTRAEAVLLTSAGTELRSEGIARRNPKDADVPESGLELATSPALSGLAQPPRRLCRVSQPHRPQSDRHRVTTGAPKVPRSASTSRMTVSTVTAV